MVSEELSQLATRLRMVHPLQLESKLLPSKTSIPGAGYQNSVACGISKIPVPRLPFLHFPNSTAFPASVSPKYISHIPSSIALVHSPITQVAAALPLAAPLRSPPLLHCVELYPLNLSACHQILDVRKSMAFSFPPPSNLEVFPTTKPLLKQ